MADSRIALRAQLERQVAHWCVAASALSDLTQFASSAAWLGLEQYLGATLRGSLSQSILRLERQAGLVRAQLHAAESAAELRQLQLAIVRLRRHYLAVEAILDFYGDAINTRTNPKLNAYLSACDKLACAGMKAVLGPLGQHAPPVLTYVDKGLGASILKAGLMLWDGRSKSSVAAIKIVRHNLQRPTSLLHEAGHQIAHIVGFTEELAEALRTKLGEYDHEVAALWAGWASELAADAFAFAHSGYASVAALHDVLSADRSSVLNVQALDPHPASYLRVLLGREMCRTFFGAGPWDAMARAWLELFPLSAAPSSTVDVLRASTPLLTEVVEVVFRTRYKAFKGRSLVEILDPERVKPDSLFELERRAGKALFVSSHWIERECLRLLALSGYRIATEPERARELASEQENWMLRLGEQAKAA